MQCFSQVVANLMNLTMLIVMLSLWFPLHGTNLAARCCIISNLWINDCWCESHMATIFDRWKHVLLGEVDNDEGFHTGILEGGLLWCKLSACGVPMTNFYSITLPISGVLIQPVQEFYTLCMYSHL